PDLGRLPPGRHRRRHPNVRRWYGRRRRPAAQAASITASARNRAMSPELRGPGRLTGQRSLLGRLIGALVTIGALVVGLMFSVVVFGVALVLGLAIWGWLWWK